MSSTSYGGTPQSGCMGLMQGSGAAPGVWTAVSTIILGAYKQCGYGAHLVGGWSNEQISLSALLYVDDTDLLHRRVFPHETPQDLVDWVQQATNHWAHLLQATGGNLKPEKCYWYLLQYHFRQGIATLTPRTLLSHHQLTIPQPECDRYCTKGSV